MHFCTALSAVDCKQHFAVCIVHAATALVCVHCKPLRSQWPDAGRIFEMHAPKIPLHSIVSFAAIRGMPLSCRLPIGHSVCNRIATSAVRSATGHCIHAACICINLYVNLSLYLESRSKRLLYGRSPNEFMIIRSSRLNHSYKIRKGWPRFGDG